MPGLRGDQVAAQLREIDPDLALILMTGWSLPKDDSRLAVFDDHLKKPFTDLDALLGVIGRAIATRVARAVSK